MELIYIYICACVFVHTYPVNLKCIIQPEGN